VNNYIKLLLEAHPEKKDIIINEIRKKINDAINYNCNNVYKYDIIFNYVSFNSNILENININIVLQNHIINEIEEGNNEAEGVIKCLVCFEEEETKYKKVFCNAIKSHSENICLDCHISLYNKKISCPLCRGKMKNPKPDIKKEREELNEKINFFNEAKNGKLEFLLYGIFDGIKDFNNDVKNEYFFERDNNIYLYPQAFKNILNNDESNNISKLSDIKYNKTTMFNMTNDILNISIKDKEDLKNLSLTILKIIFSYFITDYDIEDEDIKLMLSSFYFIYKNIDNDGNRNKFFITYKDYKQEININFFFIFDYIEYIFDYETNEDGINKRYQLIINDFNINKPNIKEKSNLFKFKYNNKTYIKTITPDAVELVIHYFELGDEKEKYINDKIRKIYILKDEDINERYKEKFFDDFTMYSHYEFLENKPLNFEFYNILIKALREEDQHTQNRFFRQEIEHNIDYESLIMDIRGRNEDDDDYLEFLIMEEENDDGYDDDIKYFFQGWRDCDFLNISQADTIEDFF
jgi:hypothetical protein